MPNKHYSDSKIIPTVLTITAVASCIMFGAVETYKLTSGNERQRATEISDAPSETDYTPDLSEAPSKLRTKFKPLRER